jgi:hypothetical protein
MSLQIIIPKLGEAAAQFFPPTKPFAKAVGLGLDLTMRAGTSIYEKLSAKRCRAKNRSNF